jgi:hypothetical protein
MLKFAGHMSVGNPRGFLAALGAKAGRGGVDEALCRAPESVGRPVGQLREALRLQTRVNVDETGNRENGAPMWIWAFAAATSTVLFISASRSCAVLEKVLGTGYSCALGSDFHGAYTLFHEKRKDLAMRLCWAHLTRSLRDIAESHVGERRVYGLRLLELKDRLFRLHHRFREDPYGIGLICRLQACAAEFLHHAIGCAPESDGACRKIVRRMRRQAPRASLSFI